MGHLRPDEREQLQAALKAVDEEETRMVRLYATGKITESVWDSLWHEWQDRRAKIRLTLESLEHQHKIHIANLDTALKIIAKVGVVYNSLERSDQKELLRHMVERVVIDLVGKIRLELRAPFAYLRDISRQVRDRTSSSEGHNKAKTGNISTGSSSERCSDSFLLCWGNRIRTRIN